MVQYICIVIHPGRGADNACPGENQRSSPHDSRRIGSQNGAAMPKREMGEIRLFKSLKRSAKGAAVPHVKATAGQPTNKMPVPEHVVIPMSMHIGAPAEPVVKKGDQVCVGTLIGKAGGFVSANIYSSVSGTVEGVAPFRMVNGSTCQAVAIAADGQQTVDPACVPPVVRRMSSWQQRALTPC